MKMKSEKPQAAARRIIVKVDRRQMADLHSLVEGCDYIAIVRTLDPDQGIMEIVATEDTYRDALKLAAYFEESMKADILCRG